MPWYRLLARLRLYGEEYLPYAGPGDRRGSAQGYIVVLVAGGVVVMKTVEIFVGEVVIAVGNGRDRLPDDGGLPGRNMYDVAGTPV